MSGKGQHDAFTGYMPDRPILVNLAPTPAASTNFFPNRRMNNFFKNYNFYRSVIVTMYVASSHDEIRNYCKVLPGRTERFVDIGKEGGIFFIYYLCNCIDVNLVLTQNVRFTEKPLVPSRLLGCAV